MGRTAKVERKTKETDIKIALDIDGSGQAAIETGMPFFNHMLDAFCRHGFFNVNIQAKGDLEVDYHHTVEDVGLALGQAFKDALGDKRGIRRFGEASCPLDETLANVVVDLSGRPYLSYNVKIRPGRVGRLRHRSAARVLCCVHQSVGYESPHRRAARRESAPHHRSLLQSVCPAMDFATQVDPRVEGVLSTKGSL
jgi:imidazoleglycerol-phosphate dehydratase